MVDLFDREAGPSEGPPLELPTWIGCLAAACTSAPGVSGLEKVVKEEWMKMVDRIWILALVLLLTGCKTVHLYP